MPPKSYPQDTTPEAQQAIIRQAFSLLGQRHSQKKRAAAQVNGRKGGRPFKPLAEIPCTCRGGINHAAGCLKGKALARRRNRLEALKPTT